ncbi:glycosyltransferase family 9 protein [Siccirubricoccus deserti]
MTQRILVIKLAALGDVVQAFGPFAAIRAHHPAAEITLLTTPPYAALLARSPWFDRIWADGRPAWHELPALWRLARRLRGAGFARVYDLQTSSRSSRYRRLVGSGAEWSGIARGASHPHANPLRDFMHTAERQREQLEMAGITESRHRRSAGWMRTSAVLACRRASPCWCRAPPPHGRASAGRRSASAPWRQGSTCRR